MFLSLESVATHLIYQYGYEDELLWVEPQKGGTGSTECHGGPFFYIALVVFTILVSSH